MVGTRVQCAICARTVDAKGPDPVEITLVLNKDDQSQYFYVHWSCLRNVVHASVPLLGESG
jgi:hypothetical protein